MRTLTFILLLVSTTYGFAQTGASNKIRRTLTISEIKKSFPYNKAKSIKLVSFKFHYPEPEAVDHEALEYQPQIPKTNGTIDLTKMFEVKTLDNKIEEKLLSILMNKDTEDTNEISFCYEPRNGIVFFDEADNVIGYIEICFECLQYKVEPTTITVTTLYPMEFDALRSIFKEVGITYGTLQSED